MATVEGWSTDRSRTFRWFVLLAGTSLGICGLDSGGVGGACPSDPALGVGSLWGHYREMASVGLTPHHTPHPGCVTGSPRPPCALAVPELSLQFQSCQGDAYLGAHRSPRPPPLRAGVDAWSGLDPASQPHPNPEGGVGVWPRSGQSTAVPDSLWQHHAP